MSEQAERSMQAPLLAPERGRLRRWHRLSPRARFGVLAALLLVLALAVRVAYVLHTRKYSLWVDEASYNQLGTGLASGHGWVYGSSAYRPPGYPFFLAAVYLVVGIPHNVWTDPRLVQAVVATITVGLIGLMALKVAGRTAALIALAIAAVYLPLVFVGEALMSESLFVPLVLGATVCALHSRTAILDRRWIALAGFLAGLAALTRGNGLVVGVAIAVVVWTGRPRLSWRAVSAPALLLAVMALTIAPWTIRNAIAEHTFIPVTTELGTTLAGTYNDLAAQHQFVWEPGGYKNYRAIRDADISDAVRDDRLLSAVASYLGHHPTYVFQATFWNTVRLLDLDGSAAWRKTALHDTDATANFADIGAYMFWAIALLAIGGLFTRAARRVPRSLWLVPAIIWLSEAPVTIGTPRFEAPIDPFVILLAALAVQSIGVALARARSGQHSLRGRLGEPTVA